MAAAALQQALRQHDVHGEVYFTTCAGDAAVRATRAHDESWDGLVAIGGDGTINEVLNGMPDPTRPLGVLPVGTANVLAMELRLPKKPAAVAAMLAAGHRRSLAIGVCNGRRFLLFIGSGVDGAVVRRLAEVRTGTLGKHKWFGPILHTVLHWPHHHLRVTLDNGVVVDGLSSILVTRVRNYGGVMQLVPGIDPYGDALHVLCFRARSRFVWAWLGTCAVFRRLRAGRHLEVHATNALRIDGDAAWQVDGDHGGTGNVAIELLPARASVFAPQSS